MDNVHCIKNKKGAGNKRDKPDSMLHARENKRENPKRRINSIKASWLLVFHDTLLAFRGITVFGAQLHPVVVIHRKTSARSSCITTSRTS